MRVAGGRHRAINYRDDDFVEVLKEAGGADVILDNMGAKYLERNVAALATEGRLVVIGMQGGTKAELDLSVLLRKRGAVIATTLRARPTRGEVGDLRLAWSSTCGRWWPRARCRPSYTNEVPLEEVARAHELMESAVAHRQDPADD